MARGCCAVMAVASFRLNHSSSILVTIIYCYNEEGINELMKRCPSASNPRCAQKMLVLPVKMDVESLVVVASINRLQHNMSYALRTMMLWHPLCSTMLPQRVRHRDCVGSCQ